MIEFDIDRVFDKVICQC